MYRSTVDIVFLLLLNADDWLEVPDSMPGDRLEPMC